MAGHLGEAKTRERLMARFFWPGIHENVRWWCAACRECQLVNPPATAKAPLHSLPLMEVPFERIGMDLIGPLGRSAWGYRFALVLVDYAMQYPEAVPLRSISAKSVAEALFRISRSKIQYVLDLRAKLHILGRLSMENLSPCDPLRSHGEWGSSITRSNERIGVMHVRFITSTC